MNNNKRNIDEIVFDNNIDNSNKKHKIDESNSGNIPTEIDISNLKSKTVAQLKEIALSIGVSFKSSTKKSDIIDSITFTINKKQELLEKQKIDDNINSFNKGVVEFTIKEGVDPSEWLFWKVFRNKFIYKVIMSNMDTHLLPTYDSIKCVDQMINSGQISMLRDKIIRNQYLTFKCGDYEIINQISNVFKKDDERDALLYKRFFGYYSKYIFHFNNVKIIKGSDGNAGEITDGLENKTILINQLIQNGCLVALKVLVQHYKFQVNNDNFITAISLGSLKFVKFILKQPDFRPIFNHNDIFNITDKIKSLKVLIHLQNEKIIPDLDESTLSKYLVECNINDIDGMVRLQVKKLIPNCQLLSTVYKPNEDTVKSITQQIELISNIFKTTTELKSFITDKSNQTTKKKEIISNLLDFIYSTCGIIGKSEYYNLYFTNSNCNVVNGTLNPDELTTHDTIKGRLIVNYKLAYQFGNIDILKNCLRSDGGNEIHGLFANGSGILGHQDFLFTHCTNIDQQYSFLKFISCNVKYSNEDFHTLLLLIHKDNLELLKLFIGLHKGSLKFRYGVTIFKYIKSIEMLEYFWVNYNDQFTLLNICDFGNVELLKKYETLYFKKNKELGGVLKYDPVYCPPKSILKRVLEAGPTIYYITIISIGTMINQCNCSTNEKFEMFKTLFLNYQFNQGMEKSGFIHNLDTVAFSKYLNWLFINYHDNLKVPEYATIVTHDRIVYNYYYKAGRYDQIQDNNYPIIHFKNGEDIPMMDYMLKKYSLLNRSDFSNKVQHTFLKLLLEFSSEGWLKSFEHIHQNHSWVFKVVPKQSTSVLDGVFKILDLKKLVFASLLNSNLVLAEFLLAICPKLTKKELDSNASDLSISYFILNGIYNKLK